MSPHITVFFSTDWALYYRLNLNNQILKKKKTEITRAVDTRSEHLLSKSLAQSLDTSC